MRRKKNLRADGRFCVRLDIKEEGGRRVRKCFYSRISLADARAKRDAYMDTHPYNAPTGTLGDWAITWLDRYKSGLEPNTAEMYLAFVRLLCNYSVNGRLLGDMPIQDIRPSHVQMFMSSLVGCSRSKIRKAVLTTRQIFDSAVDNGLIFRSPVASTLTVPQGTYTGHRMITPTERALILERWRERPAGFWYLMILLTGMRREELCALRWEDIDLTNGVIRIERASDLAHGGAIKRTKSESGVRSVPILHPLTDILAESPIVSGAVVTNAHGGQITLSAFRSQWERFASIISEASGEPPIRPHDLRTTYCSILYEKGIDPKTAQYLLGHSSVNMTLNIYTKLSEERQRDNFAMLRSAFADTQTDTH